MTDNPIYQALTDHQRVVDGWDMRTVAADLHHWGELFRLRFKLEIPLPALRLCPLRKTTLGHYFCGFNQFGLQNEIAISTIHVERCRANGEWWRVLGTVLHEHLHLWQQVHGKPGRNNYHNTQYRKYAAGFGLVVNSRGQTHYAPESPFMDLLREQGVAVPELPQPIESILQRGESKLKKWTCGCTNARVAVADFRAKCLKCDREFKRPDS